MSIIGKTLVLGLVIAAVRRIVGHELPPPPPPRKPLPTEAEIDAALQWEAERREMTHLNWKGSIVDLLQLLDVRNDYSSRGALWVDLDHDDPYTGSAEQNMRMLDEVRHRWVMGDL